MTGIWILAAVVLLFATLFLVDRRTKQGQPAPRGPRGMVRRKTMDHMTYAQKTDQGGTQQMINHRGVGSL